MGFFGKDKKKKTVRTPARNTTSRKKEESVSNLGISRMTSELIRLNPSIHAFISMYRGSEVIVIDVQKLNTLNFPKGYSLIGSTLTNSKSKEGMHEDIQLVTKFDYNFTR